MYDDGFNRDAIATTKGELVTGRNLQDRSLVVLHNYKFALKFYTEYVDSKGNNPSGNRLEDMLLYVRQKMYVAFKGCRNKPPPKQGKDNLTEDDMPPKYVFTGYMAFVLFGPQGLAEQTLGCLSTDGTQVTKKGRAATRKEVAKEKQTEREAGVGGYVPDQYRRGVSIQHKAQAAFVAFTDHNNAIKHYRELIFLGNQEQANNMRELDFIRMQMEGTINPIDYHQLEGWQDEILSRLRKLRQKKEEYKQKIQELMDNKPVKTEAFFDQVGNFKRNKADDEPSSSLSVPNKKVKRGTDEEMSCLTESSQQFRGGKVSHDDDEEKDSQSPEHNHGYVFTQYDDKGN